MTACARTRTRSRAQEYLDGKRPLPADVSRVPAVAAGRRVDHQSTVAACQPRFDSDSTCTADHRSISLLASASLCSALFLLPPSSLCQARSCGLPDCNSFLISINIIFITCFFALRVGRRTEDSVAICKEPRFLRWRNASFGGWPFDRGTTGPTKAFLSPNIPAHVRLKKARSVNGRFRLVNRQTIAHSRTHHSNGHHGPRLSQRLVFAR